MGVVPGVRPWGPGPSMCLEQSPRKGKRPEPLSHTPRLGPDAFILTSLTDGIGNLPPPFHAPLSSPGRRAASSRQAVDLSHPLRHPRQKRQSCSEAHLCRCRQSPAPCTLARHPQWCKCLSRDFAGVFQVGKNNSLALSQSSPSSISSPGHSRPVSDQQTEDPELSAECKAYGCWGWTPVQISPPGEGRVASWLPSLHHIVASFVLWARCLSFSVVSFPHLWSGVHNAASLVCLL